MKDECTKIHRELVALTSFWQRFKASPVIPLFFHCCLLAACAGGAYGLWQILPNKQVAVAIPSIGWFIFALSIFFARRRSITFRKKLLQIYAADLDVIDEEMTSCKRRGEKKYNPDKVMAWAADEILQQQKAIEDRENTAIHQARSSIDQERTRIARYVQDIEDKKTAKLKQIETIFSGKKAQIDASIDEEKTLIERKLQDERATFQQEIDRAKSTLLQSVNEQRAQWRQQCAEYMTAKRVKHVDWESTQWDTWSPSASFSEYIAVGSVTVNEASLWKDAEQNDVEASAHIISLPLDLHIPDAPLLLCKSSEEIALPCLHQCMLRFLASSPPGQARFSILDPGDSAKSLPAFSS